jgi:hypothetical protein
VVGGSNPSGRANNFSPAFEVSELDAFLIKVCGQLTAIELAGISN